MKHERISKRFGDKNRFFGKMIQLDKFSDTVPSFNFKGDQKIKTILGAFCSVMISITVLYYALLKFIQLEQGQNPTIAAYPVEARFDAQNPINLNQINFKAAFQFTSFDYEKNQFSVLDDPKFVKMIVRIFGQDQDGTFHEKTLNHHKCTDAEYEEFYPLKTDQEQAFNRGAIPKNFNCIDWDDEDPVLVYGGAF